MGSFVGHLIPAVLFLGISLWWLIDTLRSYFGENGRYTSRLIYHVTLCQCRRKVAVQAWVVLVACVLGIIVELILSPLRAHGTWLVPANVQHATMYGAFGLLGLQCIVLDYVAPRLQRRQMDYVTAAMAFVIESLLFTYHLHGRHDVDVVMHSLLIYVVYATVILLLLELWVENSLGLSVGRAFCTTLQGSWMLQVGYTMYNPWSNPWGHSNEHKEDTAHGDVMMVANMFSWHVMTVFFIYSVITLSCYRRNAKWRGSHFLLPQSDKDDI